MAATANAIAHTAMNQSGMMVTAASPSNALAGYASGRDPSMGNSVRDRTLLLKGTGGALEHDEAANEGGLLVHRGRENLSAVTLEGE